MKALNDLKWSLFKMKKLYLSVPVPDRLSFLNNCLKNPLFLEIKKIVTRLYYTSIFRRKHK